MIFCPVCGVPVTGGGEKEREHMIFSAADFVPGSSYMKESEKDHAIKITATSEHLEIDLVEFAMVLKSPFRLCIRVSTSVTSFHRPIGVEL